MTKQIIKEFVEKWKDDTQCGGYINELVCDLEKALKTQEKETRKEVLEKAIKIVQRANKETTKEHGSKNVYIDLVEKLAVNDLKVLEEKL